MVLDITDYKNGVREYTLDEARRLTERIRIAAASYAEAKEKLLSLVADAKAGNVHEQLGYASWTEYLSEVLGAEPMRLARDERQEMSQILTSEGMSTRAAAKVLGVGNKTVARDIATVSDDTVQPREVMGNDGKVRTYEPPAPREVVDMQTGEIVQQEPRTTRKPITDQFFNAVVDLSRVINRLESLIEDDRFKKNSGQMRDKNLAELTRAQEVLNRTFTELA